MNLPRRLAALVFVFAITLPPAARATDIASPKFLVGYWQQGSPETTDARPDCWRFLADGLFAFEPTRCDDSSRLVAVRGRWRFDAASSSWSRPRMSTGQAAASRGIRTHRTAGACRVRTTSR
jgi:hypothetical protein